LNDSCGSYRIKIEVLGVYAKSLMCGENIQNKELLRSATVKEYMEEINTLHILRESEPPLQIGDKNDHFDLTPNS
jgi:hypothetical protein